MNSRPDRMQGGEQASLLPLHNIRFCIECGTIGYDDEVFCSLCGHTLYSPQGEIEQKPSKACTSCGAVLRHPVACFCGVCGVRVGE